MDVTRLTGLGRGWQTRLRTFFDPPLAEDASPLELLHAVLDEIERQVEPAGRGRRVFPYTAVQVRVLSAAELAPRLEAVLADLPLRLRERLAEVRCELPPSLAVQHAVIAERPGSWAPQQRFDVVGVRVAATPAEMVSPAAQQPVAEPMTLRLSVSRGTVADGPLEFRGGTVSIGRSADPTDEVGRVRRNRVAFRDEADGVSETVGRAHARLRHMPDTGEYRLFDDGSRNGTSIVRNGEVIAVPRLDPRGVRVRTGDEIHVGRAVLTVTLDADGGGDGR